jgi:hypothetical protein
MAPAAPIAPLVSKNWRMMNSLEAVKSWWGDARQKVSEIEAVER